MIRLPSISLAYKAPRQAVGLLNSLRPALLSSSIRTTVSLPRTQLRTNMSGSAAFLEAVKARRSVYTISSDSTIPDEKIEEIIATAVKHAPSSFNVQSSRAVLLLGDEHKKLWDITIEVLKGLVPAEQFPTTEAKIKGFAAGHGTVLFFEDQESIKDLATRIPLYQDRFPTWSEHASGILQYIVWTALEAEGLGASLQHYNPLITPQVLATWKLPTSWALVSQLVFGKPTAPAGEKSFEPVEGKRFLTFGKK
ncbi:Nitroreductase [Lenzites betulinus]|nr:Nitroreductase [Lenzites betulinus]